MVGNAHCESSGRSHFGEWLLSTPQGGKGLHCANERATSMVRFVYGVMLAYQEFREGGTSFSPLSLSLKKFSISFFIIRKNRTSKRIGNVSWV